MAESESYNPFDDLDAFFNAAASADGNALREAAENVAGTAKGPSKPTSLRPKSITNPQVKVKKTTKIKRRTTEVKPKPAEDGINPQDDLFGKFLAVEPGEAGAAAPAKKGVPFVLIPANIHSFMPWWAWVSIGLGLLVMIIGVVMMPSVNLERVVARLGDENPGNVQSAMRQLVISGDERTVNKLYETAISAESAIDTRLRAVDTLGLIQNPGADRALLRLELAGSTDAQVREAAIAARRQRDSAKTSERKR